MTKLIVSAMITVLALAGLSEFIHIVKLYIIGPKRKAVTYSVVFLDKAYVKEQIDYIISETLWYGKSMAQYIIAVRPDNCIIDNEKTVQKNYNIIFCDKEAIFPTIRKLMD